MSSQGAFLSPSQYRRRRVGALLTLLGVLALVAGLAGYQLAPPSDPVPPTTTVDLRNAGRPTDLAHPYISFDCKRVVDSGVVKAGRGYKGRKWKSYYYLLAVEDRWIVAASDNEIRAGTIQGKVVQWDMPVNVSALKEVYAKRTPNDRALILPVQLNVGDYVDPPTITGVPLLFVLLGVAGGIFLLVGLFKFATSFGETEPAAVVPARPEWSFAPPRR
jgi:hypothetical protein